MGGQKEVEHPPPPQSENTRIVFKVCDIDTWSNSLLSEKSPLNTYELEILWPNGQEEGKSEILPVLCAQFFDLNV